MADTDTPFAVAAAVAEYGRAGATRAQLAYWREVESRCSPLVDAGDIPPARHRDRATITLTLDESGTAELLTHANRAYGTSAEDLLLAAFARALHARFGVTATGLTLESHGRHPLPPGEEGRFVQAMAWRDFRIAQLALQGWDGKGRLVVVGTLAGTMSAVDLRLLLSRRLVVRGTVLRSRPLEERIVVTQAYEREVLPWLASGAVTTRVDATYPLERLGEAHALVEGNGTIGKVAITVGAP
jgi:hypothetical protein